MSAEWLTKKSHKCILRLPLPQLTKNDQRPTDWPPPVHDRRGCQLFCTLSMGRGGGEGLLIPTSGYFSNFGQLSQSFPQLCTISSTLLICKLPRLCTIFTNMSATLHNFEHPVDLHISANFAQLSQTCPQIHSLLVPRQNGG